MTGCIAKSEHFFKVAIFPELIGKFFSRPFAPASHVEGESGQMIGCDNPHCTYEWFHFECLQLSAPPKKKSWYCPDCRKLPTFKKKSKN